MTSMPFIVAIVAIIGGLIYAAYEQKLKLQMEKEKSNSSAANTELLNEIAKLKERVAVLEKIVTDKNYSLKEEINNLDKAS